MNPFLYPDYKWDFRLPRVQSINASGHKFGLVPPGLGRLGVLAEPTSICARALRHARAIGDRQPWELERALVLGSGAVGSLTTMLLRLQAASTRDRERHIN